MVFQKGQSGNPAGSKKGQRPRGPVLLAMKRVLAGKGKPESDLDRDMVKWREDDFPAFVKEFNKLLAIEEGKAESVPAPSAGKESAPDPGEMKARGLIAELLEKFYQKHPEVKRPDIKETK